MRIISETNDNGPDAPIPVFSAKSTAFYVFSNEVGGFRLLRFSDKVVALCQAPAPLMDRPAIVYRRGTKAQIAAAKRTFGDESGLAFPAPVKKKPSFLRVV